MCVFFFLLTYDPASVCALRLQRRLLSPATRWCSKRRFECVDIRLRGGKSRYVFIVLLLHCNVCCMQPGMSPTGPAQACIKLYNQLVYLFISAASFLPATISMARRTKARRAALLCTHVCLLNDNIYSLQKGQDTQSTGRKQWNRAGMAVVNNAGGQLPGFMVWDPAPNPPPPGPSSFLRCTVVYTWATMNHIFWDKRGRTMRLCRGEQRAALDMWTWCRPVLITFTFSCNSKLTSHWVRGTQYVYVIMMLIQN